MLPGNVYADPTITRYHKTQLLGVKDGDKPEALISRQSERMRLAIPLGGTVKYSAVH